MKDLGKRSMPRNPLLFSIMERMDLVEQIGSGILRMRDGMIEYGLEEPVIETDENWFSITFKRKEQEHEQSIEPVKIPVNLTQLQQQILKCLMENPYMTYDELANRFKKSRETIRVNIKKLKALNLVERIGSDKKGRWQVKSKKK